MHVKCNSSKWFMAALIVGVLAVPRPGVAASFLFSSFGFASNFAVFGLTGSETITENGDTIKGNQGISTGGFINAVTALSSTTGSLYDQTGSTQYTGLNIGSPFLNNGVMTQANNDYTNIVIPGITGYGCTVCSQPDQTVTRNIDGRGLGVSVIDFTNINLGTNTSLTLQGNATDYFIVRVAGNLTLGGATPASILLNGVAASHVIIEVAGNITTTGNGDQLNGYIISTAGTMSLTSGTVVNGELIGKGNMSLTGTTVNGFTPEPSTLILIGGALIGIGVGSKRARASVRARG